MYEGPIASRAWTTIDRMYYMRNQPTYACIKIIKILQTRSQQQCVCRFWLLCVVCVCIYGGIFLFDEE